MDSGKSQNLGDFHADDSIGLKVKTFRSVNPATRCWYFPVPIFIDTSGFFSIIFEPDSFLHNSLSLKMERFKMEEQLKMCLPCSWRKDICSVGSPNFFHYKAKPIVRWGRKATGLTKDRRVARIKIRRVACIRDPAFFLLWPVLWCLLSDSIPWRFCFLQIHSIFISACFRLFYGLVWDWSDC